MLDWRNTEVRYGAVARLFHWLMGVLLFAQLAIGFIVWEVLERTATRSGLVLMHVSLGMTLLGLVLLRAAWRWRNPPPPPAPDVPATLTQGAKLGHRTLYLLMVVLPITGWLTISAGGGIGPSWFGLFRFPAIWSENEPLYDIVKVVHVYIAWILCALIVLHIGLALYHRLVRKDSVMKRMTG